MIFSRRKQVKAVLVSKVDSKFEDKLPQGMMMRDAGRIHGQAEAVNEAHWLRKPIPVTIFIFDVDGKYVELPVEKDIFERYNEKDQGILDYKGKTFYDFKATRSTSMKEQLADTMGQAEYTNWIAKRRSADAIAHYIKHFLVAAIIIALCILRVIALRESQTIHQEVSGEYSKVWATPYDSSQREDFSWIRDVRVVYGSQSVKVLRIFNVVEDGKALVYFNPETKQIVPVVRDWCWYTVYTIYGAIIIILAIRVVYVVIRLIQVAIARKQLLS